MSTNKAMVTGPRYLSYFHRGGKKPLIGTTLDAFLKSVISRHPTRDAVVSLPQDIRLSYAMLDVEVQRVARGLAALGLGRGDRVGIWATDNVEWVLLQLATARTGIILVNINPAYRPAELEHALKLARVQAIFLIPAFRRSNYVEMVTGLCPEVKDHGPDDLSPARLPDLRHIVVYDPKNVEQTERPYKGFLTWPEVIERGSSVTDVEIMRRSAELDPDDTINIQFTSGTTGFPKAVELTHHNILNNGYFVGEKMGFTPEDRLCVPVPFYHCFGMVVSNLACLTHGAAIIIPSDHFEAGPTLKAIEQERCTAVHGVPTMFVAELENMRENHYDLSSLRTGIMAGAPCPPELARRVIEDMGCTEFLIAYGMTESSPVTHITLPNDSFERRVRSVGTNMPHQEVKVVNPETGAMLPFGEQGEICFRGYHVMRGYYGDDAATKLAIDRAGWLHSGDLGVMDTGGYVRITGRLKDMIIRGGENIYPAEIEAFYYQHPQVAEIAVFGVPDERLGEEVGAFVKLHDGETSDTETLRNWARERIAHYKVPRFVWIVDEFPMTVTGKIQKFKMREMAEGWLAEEKAKEKANSKPVPAGG